jgi:hypothetical protein
MKRAELEKLKGKKIDSRTDRPAASGRPDGAGAPDRREQRRRDQALGLVPFAVKLHRDLVSQLQARAAQREGDMNAVVAELLQSALKAR